MLSEAEYYLLVQKSVLHPFTISDIESEYLRADPQRWSVMASDQWRELANQREKAITEWVSQAEALKGLSKTYKDAVRDSYLNALDKLTAKIRQYEIAIEAQGRQTMAQEQGEDPRLAALYRRAIERHMQEKMGPVNHDADIRLWDTLRGNWE